MSSCRQPGTEGRSWSFFSSAWSPAFFAGDQAGRPFPSSFPSGAAHRHPLPADRREDVKEGTQKALSAFWGVALTPGATGGIPEEPMGGGVGKEEAPRHPPTSPVVGPEGPGFWFPAVGVQVLGRRPRRGLRPDRWSCGQRDHRSELLPDPVSGAGRRRRSAFWPAFSLPAFCRPALGRSAGRAGRPRRTLLRCFRAGVPGRTKARHPVACPAPPSLAVPLAGGAVAMNRLPLARRTWLSVIDQAPPAPSPSWASRSTGGRIKRSTGDWRKTA